MKPYYDDLRLRVIETVPQNYGENITMLASLSLSGIEAPMTINGAVNGVVFKVYVEQILCPTLKTGDVVAARRIRENLAQNSAPDYRSRRVMKVQKLRICYILTTNLL